MARFKIYYTEKGKKGTKKKIITAKTTNSLLSQMRKKGIPVTSPRVKKIMKG